MYVCVRVCVYVSLHTIEDLLVHLHLPISLVNLICYWPSAGLFLFVQIILHFLVVTLNEWYPPKISTRVLCISFSYFFNSSVSDKQCFRYSLMTFWNPRLWLEGSYDLGSLRPSVFQPGSFLGIDSLVFFETQHGARSPCCVVRDSQIFWKKENEENGPKIGFFEFIGKFSHYFCLIWSIKKAYIICCIVAQILYFGKIWFLRYWSKCSQPIRLQDF